MSLEYLLSIDQGTTGTTALLMDTKGRIRAKVGREFKQFFPKPGWVEHRPKDIWQSALGAVRGVMNRAGIKAQRIIAVGITNQRETVMAWDRETENLWVRPLSGSVAEQVIFVKSSKKKPIKKK